MVAECDRGQLLRSCPWKHSGTASGREWLRAKHSTKFTSVTQPDRAEVSSTNPPGSQANEADELGRSDLAYLTKNSLYMNEVPCAKDIVQGKRKGVEGPYVCVDCAPRAAWEARLSWVASSAVSP